MTYSDICNTSYAFPTSTVYWEQLRHMVNTQGQLPQKLLNHGLKTKWFFRKERGHRCLWRLMVQRFYKSFHPMTLSVFEWYLSMQYCFSLDTLWIWTHCWANEFLPLLCWHDDGTQTFLMRQIWLGICCCKTWLWWYLTYLFVIYFWLRWGQFATCHKRTTKQKLKTAGTLLICCLSYSNWMWIKG